MVFKLVHAHAMVMILAWMVFASTGILIARYGRSLRLGNRRQCLGKAVWFQIHRFLLSITPLLTLLGFFLILVFAGGQWVDYQVVDIRIFVHSILGGIIVCCGIIQIWLALYRCAPRSQFRCIFNWCHRITGILAFTLSMPTMFIMVSRWSTNRTILIGITSTWIGWIVMIVFSFEKIEYQQRAAVLPVGINSRQVDVNSHLQLDTESGENAAIGNRCYYQIKLFMFFFHIIISITLAILLIFFICQ